MAGSPISDNLSLGSSGGGERVRVSFGSSHGKGFLYPSVDTAAANEPVADHPDIVGLERGAPPAQPDGGDAERMEQERQSRLKRWQAQRT